MSAWRTELAAVARGLREFNRSQGLPAAPKLVVHRRGGCPITPAESLPPSGEFLERGEVVQVLRAGVVTTVEADLLFTRKAWRYDAADQASGEPIGWVVEVATIEVGLAAMSNFVKVHGVQVQPGVVLQNQLHPDGSPVRLHPVPECTEHVQRSRLIVGVDCEIEIPMMPGLVPDQRVDPPSPGDPEPTADLA